MSITIFIKDEDIEDNEIEDFTFDINETVDQALSRFLKEQNINEEGLRSGAFSFRVNNTTELVVPKNFNLPLSKLVKNNQIIFMKETKRDYTIEAAKKMPDPEKPPRALGFCKKAPKWRIIYKGLNVFGKCSCIKCEAKGKTVICPKRKCTIDFCEEGYSFTCPICTGIIRPITIGFYMCDYKIYGKKVEGNRVEDFGPIVRKADDKNHSQYYDPSDGVSTCISYVVEVTNLL